MTPVASIAASNPATVAADLTPLEGVTAPK
jgi:hypothetical protein